MPYIDQAERADLRLHRRKPETVGELNYVISDIANNYINRKGLSYAAINEVVGVLECARLELYRRRAAPYEDAKCQANGDVYG